MASLARRDVVKTVRRIYERLPKVIRVPDALQDRRVEVILLPLDDAIETFPEGRNSKNSIEDFEGAWKGKPLVRPEQGKCDAREPLR
jgi:hypothetical protein